MNRLNKVFAIAAVLLSGIFLVQVTAYAHNWPNPKNHPHYNGIVGLWDVQVTINDCDSGAKLGGFVGLHKFEVGGTGQVVPATNPAGLSAHMMLWNHVKKNDYLMTVKMFRFDTTGKYIGWVVLTFEFSTNNAIDKYEGSGISEAYDTAGEHLSTSCPSLQATRFTGE